MPQHFLLSAEARSLSVREIFSLSEDSAFELFRELRWGKSGKVACLVCGVGERHWFLPSRRQWRCKACAHTFSVTSGTIFAHHKLPLRVYLAAVELYTYAAKGLSALQVSLDLGCNTRPPSCSCTKSARASWFSAMKHGYREQSRWTVLM